MKYEYCGDRTINPAAQFQRIYDSIPRTHPDGAQTYHTVKEAVFLIIYCGIGFAELYRVRAVISIGIFVHPSYRGRGYGKRLVRACQAYARQRHEAIEWYVRTDNTASRALAQSCGFKLIPRMSNEDMKLYLWENRRRTNYGRHITAEVHAR